MAFIVADRVKETSTSTGIGALTLAGAATAFRPFSSVCAVGDTAYYALQAVDGSGIPTGDWECGLGTYSAANTLTRSAVTSSSNAGEPVSLAAGGKEVYISLPAVQVAWVREKLSAPRTYYVDPVTGSDTSDGLSALTPFLTVQAAIDALVLLDMGNHGVTIQLADGTHFGGSLTKPYVGAVAPTILGNEATPGNVVFPSFTHSASGSQEWLIYGVKHQGSTAITCSGGGNKVTTSGGVFGTSSAFHMFATEGGQINASWYGISGAAGSHISAQYGGKIKISGTVTISASLSIGTFSEARQLSCVDAIGATFSLGGNTITGNRYVATRNSIIMPNGASETFFPGTVAGSLALGSQYG